MKVVQECYKYQHGDLTVDPTTVKPKNKIEADVERSWGTSSWV